MAHWSYPPIMVLAVLVGAWLSRRSQAGLGLTAGQRLALGLGAFAGAMIGAKLPFAVADGPGLVSGRAWLGGGKTIVFGLVGGYVGVEFAKWRSGVTTKTGDSFAVPVAASVAVGRVACFVGGCCYGAPTDLPWGVDFGDGLRRHPTQLYEAAFHLAMAAVLVALARRGLFRLQRIKLYILTYLGYRFLTEFLRPEPVLAVGLTGYQWAAIALVPVFALLWIVDRPASRALSRAGSRSAGPR